MEELPRGKQSWHFNAYFRKPDSPNQDYAHSERAVISFCDMKVWPDRIFHLLYFNIFLYYSNETQLENTCFIRKTVSHSIFKALQKPTYSTKASACCCKKKKEKNIRLVHQILRACLNMKFQLLWLKNQIRHQIKQAKVLIIVIQKTGKIK